jgi:hypothetical protein
MSQVDNINYKDVLICTVTSALDSGLATFPYLS